jgi:hypothetical protein
MRFVATDLDGTAHEQGIFGKKMGHWSGKVGLSLNRLGLRKYSHEQSSEGFMQGYNLY